MTDPFKGGVMPNGEITAREHEVWELMAKGFNNDGIAEELCIDYRTVERHVTSLFSKTKRHRIGKYHPRVWLALNYRWAKQLENNMHGDKLDCPVCGAPGRFDVMRLGKDSDEAEFDDAIWISRHGNGWECYNCFLK